MNIYVGNLSWDATEEGLKEIFDAYGEVASVSIIKDKFTGKSRGFGFVEMPNDEEAQKAIEEMNGKEFAGRNLTVNQAKPRAEGGNRGGSRGGNGGSRGGFGGSGGRGGFGGGRGRY